MEVNSSFRRVEKFKGRLGTISLKEFKAIFSIVVCELELKYGVNYIEVFAFKQLTRYVHYCCKTSLRLATKARVCKSAGQEGGPGGTSYTLGNVGECERMSPHTPKWAPTWGVGVPMESWIFKEQLKGSKPIGLKSSLYNWKDVET